MHELQMGCYQPCTHELPNRLAALVDFESLVERKLDIFNWFVGWTGPFPLDDVLDLLRHGTTPMISWIPEGISLIGEGSILSGAYNSYIDNFASAIEEADGEIYIRLMPEMNGDWPSYGTGQEWTRQDFLAAWVHVVRRMRSTTRLAKFVWCPNASGPPGWNGKDVMSYYPGDEYVDFAGIDGYNWGEHASWSAWTPWETIFGGAYEAITARTRKPIIICETGCAERGGDKAEWIIESIATVKADMPQIMAIIWFNQDKEEDWRVQSSLAAVHSFRLAVNGFVPGTKSP